ncbi:hypothetical protein [Streptomyces aureocirculatus]|uniref:hypothetical protein n=1 Tax=Streptomyces aureocirculatus TaxID=67275 RepID=UPI0012FF1DD2|nr:hypothetical protein [Streptomyces aureocirculatus]
MAIQSLELLFIVLAIVACILWIAREINTQTRTPTPAAQRPEADGAHTRRAHCGPPAQRALRPREKKASEDRHSIHLTAFNS